MIVRRRAAVFGVSLVLGGCIADGTEFLALPPQGETAGSAISLGEEPGEETMISAHDLRGQGALLVPPSKRFYLLLYEQTLEELQLKAGTLHPEGLDCVLTKPIAVLRADLTDADPSWLELDEPDEALDRLVPDRRQRCAGCRSITSFLTPLDDPVATATGRERSGAAEFLPDGRVLFARNSPGQLFLLDQAGEFSGIAGCDGRYRCIAPAGDNSYWMGRPDGLDLVEIEPDAGSCRIITSTTVLPEAVASSDRNCWIDGETSTSSPDFFFGLASGYFFRYREGELEPIVELSTDLRISNGVAAFGPGKAVLAAGSADIAIYRDGELELRTLELPEGILMPSGVNAVGRTGDGNVVIASSEAQLFQLESDGAFRVFHRLQQPGECIAPYRDGFLLVSKGQIFQWGVEEGLCAPHNITGLLERGIGMKVQGNVGFIPIAELSGSGHAAWVLLK